MDDATPIAGAALEWTNRTIVHPLGLLLVIGCGLAMLSVRRRYAVWPMIVVACFVAPAQRIVVFSLDFSLLRVMVLFGWARLILQRENSAFRWTAMDRLVIAGAATMMVCRTVLYGSIDMLVQELGSAFDSVGMYLMFRCLIRDFGDVETTIRGFVYAGLPVLAAFIIENQTGRNLFAFFGGVPEITLIREGRMRCQGAFAHPIMAGCFWAALMPMMAAPWWGGAARRRWAVIGLATAAGIVVLCASSTPVTCVAACVVGAVCFRLRRHMSAVRWGIVLTVVGLHLVMKAPVWHLIARLDLVGGSTGWHRYNLIDQAIQRIGEWWLVGTRTTGHWGYGMQDVTNQYVFIGVQGGMASLALFVALLAAAFAAVGRTCRDVGRSRYALLLSWSLGVALFAHCMNFIAVTYFGQIEMVWHLHLAMIASVAVCARTQARRAAALARSVAPMPPHRAMPSPGRGDARGPMRPAAPVA